MTDRMLAMHSYFPPQTVTVYFVRASSIDAVTLVDPNPDDPPGSLGVLVMFGDGASIQVPVPREIAIDTVQRIVDDVEAHE